MAKKVKQFRFYSVNDTSKNNPQGLSYRSLISGSAFNECMPIMQLGIQSLPGTKFYLNNSNSPIIVGYTGIYELDLQGVAEITALSFDAKSLEAVNGNANSYLIIDMIYEKED